MKNVWVAIAILAALVLSTALRPARPMVDVEAAATAELLALHKADRRAHFAHDVDALLATLPDTFTYVRDGKVETQSKESLRKRFREYFRGAEFTAWDDLEPPEKRGGKWFHVANTTTVEPQQKESSCSEPPGSLSVSPLQLFS